ncbi:terminase small subunit [Kitasatospora acidiphila]|uniref:Terminase small subunit n=1 Tax=Kitasatospora acidiphila TaxID=2567942 RepID=A0A540W708_9ACTN|nr:MULTISPECIES: terminase small subunit [Kitasatospora]MCC9307746.1 terminase small subunit [Kitasatospora humi]TQF04802.1 terminase small subunit [Kitasatospora acidiphila]
MTVSTLPAPLLKQAELETYYGVSDWTVNKWVRDGCPVTRLRGGGRRFDLDEVKAWHAEEAPADQKARAARARDALARRTA